MIENTTIAAITGRLAVSVCLLGITTSSRRSRRNRPRVVFQVHRRERTPDLSLVRGNPRTSDAASIAQVRPSEFDSDERWGRGRLWPVRGWRAGVPAL
jgi:hypothetical protein